MDKKSVIIRNSPKRDSKIFSQLSLSDKETNNVNIKKSLSSPVATLKEEETNVEVKESAILEEKGVKKDDVRSMDVHGVRISPAVVRFSNTFENQRYTETVSVQNISDISITVRIYSPRAWSFRLVPLERGYLLAPGLKICRRLHYTCTKNGIVHSTLPIYINEKVIELPLEAYKGQAFVEITPISIQFGRVDIGCKPVERKIRIKNVSFCATKFLVDLGNNELDLHVVPLKGWIRPNSSVTVYLKLLALKEGIVSSELWITTDLSQTRIHVEVEAWSRKLLVFHPNTISEFTLVDFPLTFYGCCRYQTLMVYNMAASTSAFVVLADYGSGGQEPFGEAKKRAQRHVEMFDIEPVEGKIRPFEKRIFTVWFRPKITLESESTRRRSDNSTDMNDYLCTIRIRRIQVDDHSPGSVIKENVNINSSKDNRVGLAFSRNSKSSDNSFSGIDKESEEGVELTTKILMEEISVLLYFYGEAEFPTLHITPDALHYPNTLVGTTIVKVIHITNKTKHTLAFKYKKLPFFDVFPDFKKLDSNTTYDVTVKLCARNIGALKNNLIFEILAEENATDKLNFHPVNHVIIKIFGDVKAQKAVPQPKFNPGITPLITHEVGFLTDEVTFASKIEKPRCAITLTAKHGRPWYKTDATIAFPNDRPLTLRPRATDASAKTIYKGLPRYMAPVDESQTFTLDKLAIKKAHDDGFLKYLRGTAALSITKDCCLKWEKQKVDSDPPPVFFEEKEPKLPREVFVPLTFVQLYRIRVYPPLISFGSVTSSKSCSQALSISNDNDFEVSARIAPLTSGISIQTLEHFIIPGNSEAKVMLTFQREKLGRYNGTITCIINGFHSFDIAVIAEVVYRTLTITPEYVEIKIPDIPFADLCVPVAINNPLNIPITFSWVVPDESPIKIEPVHGVAPKLGTVWCGVFFEPENPNYKLYPLKLMVEGSVALKLKTGVVLPKTNVYFLQPILNLGNIPMNIMTTRRLMVFNPDFSDAMFVILNKEPAKGVKVIPSSGSIKAKSCLCLTLHITVPHEKVLDFTIYMTLQNSMTIEIKVTGNVVYPEVELTPKYINLHRVPCNSVSRTSLLAENKSKAKAEVTFRMDEYPQFKVSLSKRHHDPELTSSGFTLEPGASQKFYLHFIPKDLASYDFYLPVIINGLYFSRNSSNKEMEAQGRIILRGMSRDGSKSPLKQSKKLVMSHLVLINVVVLKESLVFSNLKLIFSTTSEIKSFSIRNASEQPVVILIRSDDFQGLFDFLFDNKEAVSNRGSFRLTIDPGDSITYNVIFTATSPGLHISDVNIQASFEDHSYIYNTVRLTGNIPLPCIISPSVKEIYFQPVPLNVEISFMLHLKIIHNQPNKETVINYEIVNPHKDLFTIEYPKGNVVAGITDCDLLVNVTFQSSFPISLRKQLIFKGGEHADCFVMMIATADSCLLTTHAFHKAHFTNKPRLQAFEEVTETLTVMENEKRIPPKQQVMNQAALQTKDNLSDTSDQSLLSMKTIDSISQASKSKRSGQISQTSKRLTVAVEKDLKLLKADIDDLSFYLSEHEDKPPSRKESLMVAEAVRMEDEKTNFPMFPLQVSVNENAVYMKQTLNSVQQWVFEQVFCCSYNPIFGSHSFSSFSVVDKKEYSLSSPVALKNVFDILERVCGRRVRRFFTPIDKMPEDEVAKSVFTFNLYRQLIEFMEVQGALIAHVEPKYLMVYDEYSHYHRSTHSVRKSFDYSSTDSQISEDDNFSEIISAEKFQSISMQCWLDLFLQMYKTLVLGPVVGVTYCSHHEDSRSLIVHSAYSREFDKRKSLYGRAEDILLNWLSHHYNTQRTIVWPNKPPPPRTVTNFDVDLEDGLVLTATTAAYCPYLNQIYFYDMCLHPSTISQAYHNTTCLCMAWAKIKLGFSISPRDFVQSNMIKMLLLVTHLYKILPSYKPETTITFRAILNASESQIVTLENNEELSITYQIQILPNSTNFFLEDFQDSFVLKRKSKGQITVQYMARNTNKAEAILLLCGACMPPKFGRNYVFKLEGYPVKLPVSSSFNIVSPQNVPLDTEITVVSPHILDHKSDESYSYELWMTYTEPQPGNINALCWAKERKRKMPRRLFFSGNTLVVTPNKMKNGSGKLAFTVCCYSLAVRDFWLIFRNPDIGDFIVKLQISPLRPEPAICLEVTVNQDTKCTCVSEQAHNCFRTKTVNVPCRNLEQWAAVRTMFELTISPEEKEFWASYIESNIGFRLLQWMLEEKKETLNQELVNLFKKSKTYKITCSSKHVSFTHPTLRIPDVRCESVLPMEVHLDETTPSHSALLMLTSTDGFEMRCYNLKIIVNSENS